jgi:hypothetical protein
MRRRVYLISRDERGTERQTMMTTTTTETKAMSESEARDAARALCRGDYQRAIVDGEARWSGADLVGEARRWAARYAESRRNLLARIQRAGIPARVVKANRHGLLVLRFGGEVAS